MWHAIPVAVHEVIDSLSFCSEINLKRNYLNVVFASCLNIWIQVMGKAILLF